MSIKDKFLSNLKECAWKTREQGWRGMYNYSFQVLHNARLKAGIHKMGSRYSNRLPRKIQIEPTSKCNLNCPTCSHRTETDTGRNLMPDEFNYFLKSLPAKPSSIILSGIGEPLINPCFADMIDILSANGINCELFTNGTLFTSRIQQVILACSNISSISISLDGARKETFESMRAGADFEKWKLYVNQFNQAAGQRQPFPILTSTHTVLSKVNFDEVEEIVLLCARMGFGHMHFLDLVPVNELARNLSLSDHECLFARDRIFKTAKMLKMHVTIDLRRKEVLPKANLRCLHPWDYIMIKINGDVLPCPAVFGSDKAIMGNIFQQDFNRIWYGPKFENFRKTSLEGKNDFCNVCPYY